MFSLHLIHIPAAHHTGADGLSRHLLSDEDPPEEDDFEDWLDNSYSFLITLLNDRISPYGGLAHFSRHPPGPLSHGCLVQLASYEDALPTCLDSHHNDLAIPCTAKACAKDDQIDRICDFLCDHVHPPDLSDADYTSFVNVATCFFLLNRPLYH